MHKLSERLITKTISIPRRLLSMKLNILTSRPQDISKNEQRLLNRTNNAFREEMKEGDGITYHLASNPIQERPADYAKEMVNSRVLQLVERKLLKHSGHEVLAREFVIAFIDKFREQMGLPEKDEYSLAEVHYG